MKLKKFWSVRGGGVHARSAPLDPSLHTTDGAFEVSLVNLIIF